VHNYDAQQHRAGQIISVLTLQTITIAQMLPVGGKGGCLAEIAMVAVSCSDGLSEHFGFWDPAWHKVLCVSTSGMAQSSLRVAGSLARMQ